MDKSNQHLSIDWKNSTNDGSIYLPHYLFIGIRLAYLAAFCMLCLGAWFGYKTYRNKQSLVSGESAEIDLNNNIQRLSTELSLIRDGSNKFVFINDWIKHEMHMQFLLLQIIKEATNIKLDSLIIKTSSDRKYMTLEMEIIGAGSLISDYSTRLLAALKDISLEPTNFEQPRIPGGSRLILNLKQKDYEANK